MKYLRALGAEVFFFPAHDRFVDYYNGKINRLIFRIGISDIYRRINDEFRAVVEEVKPDVIWVFKGLEIYPESLQWARRLGAVLVNYNPDNPFIFSGRGSGNRNITRAIPLYDLHFTYNFTVKHFLEERFKIRSVILPFGFEVAESTIRFASDENEVYRVCFLGNPDRYRAHFISLLANSGILLSVYGNNWTRFVKHSNIEVHQAVQGDEFWRVLRKYRVQLNLMRPHNLDSHNMRTFEVPAVGGIMVAPDTPDHRLYFRNGRDIFVFSDVAECIDAIQRLMILSHQEANEIRISARRHSVTSQYSYKDRAEVAFKELSNLR